MKYEKQIVEIVSWICSAVILISIIIIIKNL